VSRAVAAPTPPLIAFGPVPSRRLGRSVGINNIPPKACTYACVYCQLGRTTGMGALRRRFYGADTVVSAVERKVHEVREAGERIDFLTFVPDGEPTLDADLGAEIRAVKRLGVRVAVISNSSLVHLEDVRADLARADWVSLKLDAADERTWRAVDRPHRSLRLDRIVEGMAAFRDGFGGRLVTETMLASGVNDGAGQLEALAALLGRLRPRVAYLAVPTRPPAEPWVRAPGEDAVNRAYQIVARAVGRVELLTRYEGDAFCATGDSEADLLSIGAVHPLREEAVGGLLRRNGDGWVVVERLLQDGRLVALAFEGRRYYLRRLH
jgi:wyosine [tRNA(Phe)-imidazoG37] synthetase (radical SAM superfamily)